MRQARRVSTLFSLSKHWKRYDVFSKQKTSTFRSSRPAVLELAGRYNEIVKQLETSSSNKSEQETEAAERVLFTEMCEICLWGNATDLSLLTNLSYDDIQKLQGSQARKAAEENIIANDLPAAFDILRGAQKAGNPDRRVDIVLDNAGFELYVDLILAGYLLEAGLATVIVLHPKNIPWFVSDVVPKDFADLFSILLNAAQFYETPSEDDTARGVTPAALSTQESEALQTLSQHWTQLYAEGKIVLRPNGFWTEGGSFWRLPAQAPSLYEDLKESELVIFKGDLNYRKLTGDVSGPSIPVPPSFSCVCVSHSLSSSQRHQRLMLPFRFRQSGTQQPHSRPLSVPWVQALGSASSLYAPAKQTSWSACPTARTRDCALKRAEAATAGRGSGLGVGSGLSCNSAMAKSRHEEPDESQMGLLSR